MESLLLVVARALGSSPEVLRPMSAQTVSNWGGQCRAVFGLQEKRFAGSGQRSAVGSGSRSVVAKCFSMQGLKPAARARVVREISLARWASERGLGPPVLAVHETPEAWTLVTERALGDLGGLMQEERLLSYHTVKDLFKKAFAVVVDEALVSKGLVCADLKPSNLLVFLRNRPAACDLAAAVKRGFDNSALDLCMTDFDPFFWAKAKPEETAELNRFLLLVNSVLRPPKRRVAGPYLPLEALVLADKIFQKEPGLLALLERHLPLLQKGPCHYASLVAQKPCPDVAALVAVVQSSLLEHGVTPPPPPPPCDGAALS